MDSILFLYKQMSRGGAEKVIFDIAKKFNNKNEYNIIIATESLCEPDLFKSCKLKLYNVKFNNINLISFYINLKNLINICKENNIKIIHSHHRLTTLYALILSKILKVKVIHTEHNVFPNKNWINIRGKNIIAVSQKVKDSLISNGVNRDYIQVIYNGINLEEEIAVKNLKIEYGLKNEDFCIGVIARLTEQKGIKYLLEAFKNININHKDIYLFIIGDGELKEEINNYIINNDLSKNIILTGTRTDVMNIISSLDCYVLPSIYEGFPVTNLEIMCNERIVIATDVGGNNEVIEDGVNGFLIEAKSSDAIQKKIEYILENKEKLEKMNKNARKTIEDKFNIDDIYLRYVDYYDNLLGKV